MICPYYRDELVTIYHGDCRKILPQLELGDIETIITDPVWPNAKAQLIGRDDPLELFKTFCSIIPRETQRLVIQLGCDTDPRFLLPVPQWLKFLRTCWLDYARPSYKGRLLYTGDVAYVFGIPPDSIPGRRVMSGMFRSSCPDKLFARSSYRKGKDFDRRPEDKLLHPAPRRLDHVSWLVRQFSDKNILDPFLGSGTTLVAAKRQGKKAIGIEIEEKFIILAIDRLRQQTLPLNLGSLREA